MRNEGGSGDGMKETDVDLESTDMSSYRTGVEEDKGRWTDHHWL